MIASTTAPSALRAPCGHHRAASRTSVIARVAGKQLTGPRVVKGPVFVTRDVRFGDGRESGSGERGAPVRACAHPCGAPRAGLGMLEDQVHAARGARELEEMAGRGAAPS